MIPYGRHSVSEDDIEAVVAVLKSDWLTQGPQVGNFEHALAAYCGQNYGVAVANGTGALQAAFAAIGIGDRDEFITSPLTFAATANAGLWQGARPIFVDIDPATGNIDHNKIEEKISNRTKAIVPVDFSGRPADLEYITDLARKYNLAVIEDAAQGLGAVFKKKKVGSISDFTIFSFHPVKSITTGEGGAVMTGNKEKYQKMKRFISHGITKEFTKAVPAEWYSEMTDLGLNYRLTDLQCALGISQLKKIDLFLEKRRQLAEYYHESLKDLEKIILPARDDEDYKSAWHLYVLRLSGDYEHRRDEIFKKLRSAGIGVQVHYLPVYWHPFYQRLGYKRGLCPEAEKWSQICFSIPLFPDLSKKDQDYIIEEIRNI